MSYNSISTVVYGVLLSDSDREKIYSKYDYSEIPALVCADDVKSYGIGQMGDSRIETINSVLFSFI